MSLSVLQNGSRASLTMEPFPHLVIEPALPGEVYEQLAVEYPESTVIEQGGHEHGFTCRYFGHQALGEKRISPLWASFVRYHASGEFFRKVVALLEPALERHYPRRLGFLQSATTTLREEGKADIELECQFVVNLPSRDTVRTIHLDNPRELYALLFYMRSAEDRAAGGDLELYENMGTSVRLHGKREVDPGHVRRVKEVPYATNKVVLFLNTAASFHGVSPRVGSARNRKYLNIIAELPRRTQGVVFSKRTTPWFDLES